LPEAKGVSTFGSTMRDHALPVRLNSDWIAENLAIGGCFPVEAAENLARQLGIRRVVDLRAEACDEELALRRHGIAFLHLPTEDQCAIAPELLRAGVAWVGAALDRGYRVLIHCQHGIGRSALLALCVLVSRGATPTGALQQAKRARRVVSPSPEQLQAFIAFSREVQQTAEARWQVPTFEALAAVAYCHAGLW
jgi:predicted protein tyrosine phosphatase